MKQWIAGVMVLLWITPVWADDPNPMDFAKGIVLSCDEDASIYRFTLPEFVYDILTRPDFGDMRIFNRDGEALPFTLKRSDEGRIREETPPSLPIIFFPVYQRDVQIEKDRALSVHIQTDDRGAVIDVSHAGKPEGREGIDPVGYYLLDLSQVEKKPDRLEFGWNRGQADRVIRISVWGSQDLDRWTPLVASAVLADIRMGDHAVTQDTVELPYYESRYVKIVMPETTNSVSFTRVTGHYRPSRVYDDTPRNWTRIPAHRSQESPSEVLFRINGHFPVDRVRITFARKNTLTQVRLESKNDEQPVWSTRYNGLLYHLTAQGMIFEKTQIDCGRVSDNTWRLTLDPREGGTQYDLPLLDVGWLPHAVIFVARGDAPFTLAYGSSRVGPHEDRMEPLLSGIDADQEKYLVRDASMTSTIELGGRKQLEKPWKPLPWNRIALWGILLVGVGLCAGMAFSLYRQMKAAPKSD